jgi:hypothetical protein
VTPTTISNCFKKAGFGEHLVWEEEDDLPLAFIKKNENNAVNNNDGDLREQYEAWMLLNRKEFEESNFNDFIHVDAEVFTSDFPTDDDIVENIQSPLEETGSNDDPVVETLCTFLYTEENTTEELYKNLNNIEAFFETSSKNNKKQTLITDFFSANTTN